MKTFPMRSLTTVLAVTSFLFLTAAKGDGCGPSIIVEPPTPIDPPVCAIGSHIETICDGGPVVIESTTSSSSGTFGSATSSTSGDFGTGGASSGTTVGAGGFATTGGGVGGFSTTGGGPDEPPPSTGSCHDECVPDEVCGPGTHAEVVCAVDDIDYGSSSSSGSSSSGSSSGGSGVAEPYPGDCQVMCVPDAVCPPGTHAEPVCGGEDGGVSTTSSSSSSSSGSSSSGGSGGYGGGEEPPAPGACPMSCVPDQCPPGMTAVEVCDDSCDGMATCWIECQEAIDPNGT